MKQVVSVQKKPFFQEISDIIKTFESRNEQAIKENLSYVEIYV